MLKKVDTVAVPDFVRSNLVVVLYTSALKPPTEQVFRAMEEADAATAWVETGGYMLSTMWSWVHERQRALGWAEIEQIPDGYYLFVGGEVRAFRAGLINFKTDKASLGIAAVLAIGGLFAKNMDAISAGFDVAQAEASQRVIADFTQLAEFYKLIAEPAREAPLPPEVDELAQAIAVLGLDESATKADVKQRRMDLIKEWHPDQFATDPAKFKGANERLAQINAAYGVIMMRRGWT